MVSRQLAAYLEEHQVDIEDMIALAVEARIQPLLEELRRLRRLNADLLDENETLTGELTALKSWSGSERSLVGLD